VLQPPTPVLERSQAGGPAQDRQRGTLKRCNLRIKKSTAMADEAASGPGPCAYPDAEVEQPEITPVERVAAMLSLETLLRRAESMFLDEQKSARQSARASTKQRKARQSR